CRNNFFNNTFFIDDKSCTMYSVIFTTHEFLWSPHTKSIDNRLVIICNKRKRQAVFILKLSLFFGRVGTYTQQFEAFGPKAFVIIAQVAYLCSTAGGISLWIKEHHQFLASIV